MQKYVLPPAGEDHQVRTLGEMREKIALWVVSPSSVSLRSTSSPAGGRTFLVPGRKLNAIRKHGPPGREPLQTRAVAASKNKISKLKTNCQDFALTGHNKGDKL